MKIVHSLFRRIELQLLMNLTARAFRQPPRRTWTRSNDEALRIYAEYTRRHLQDSTADAHLLQRMNSEAYSMGCRLRRLFRLKKDGDVNRFIALLYHNIGIDIATPAPHQLCFSRCFFSRYYTPEMCLAASALDDGIIRGLTGCRHLAFSQRITEGFTCCLATTTNQEQTINTHHPT